MAVQKYFRLGSRGSGMLLVWLLWLLGPAPASGQADSLGGIASKLLRYEKRGPQEKLFLHLDRPLYLSGETMWFKVYAAEGTYSRPLALSSVAYVEVLDAKNRPVLQGKVALKQATGQGSFLLPTGLPSGSYTVRAYTSWMKNFSPEAYFHASVQVVNTFAASGASAAAKDSATTYDAQFFPEGGNLVRGLRSKVGVKLTDKAGRGIAATGKLLSPAGEVVATFSTQHLGMGNFTFTPATTAAPYTAVLTLGTGGSITRPLPRVYEQGYVIRLEPASATQLSLTVEASNQQAETLFLLAHSRQHTAFAMQAQLVNGRAVFMLDKERLLEGVSHLTLFNADQKPLCERLYFRPPSRTLALTASTDKPSYAVRDKVSLQVGAENGSANLSVAVYRLDSLNTTPAVAINHYLSLTSDLQGRVENPGYYFAAASPEVEAAADNLMLTQGWSRFRWEDVLAARPFEFVPEVNGPIIRGRLTQAGTDLPRPGIHTYLSAPNRLIRLSTSQSNPQGLVQFELDNLYGPQELIAQTDPQQDSTCRITLFDPFSQRYAAARPAPFALAERFRSTYAARHLQSQTQTVYFGKYRNRYLSPVVDSLPFYGPPDEAYLLDKYTRFKVLEEVMREYVPGVVVRIRKDGFHFLVVDKVNKTVLTENPLVLLDGVPVFNLNKIMALSPLKVRKLEVIDSRYFHGSTFYNGIVSFSTYRGDLEGFQLDPRVLVQQYEGLQQQREFYAPRYDTPEARQSRLPDLRNLLYWNPNVTTTGPAARQLEFYTGDQAGRYLVVVQGLTPSGLAGSTSFTFEVKQPL